MENYFVYQHVTPDGMYYFGVTNNIKERFCTSAYKTTALKPYIEKYGWNNIQHVVLFRNETYESSRFIEDFLIQTATLDGVCINKNRSGLIWKNNEKEYYKQYHKENEEHYKEYNEEHKEEIKERHKKYYEEQKEKLNEYSRQYKKEHKEEIKEYRKQYHKKYYEEHKEEIKQYQKQHYQRKKQENQNNNVN